MELIINLYQEKADKAIGAMLKARKEYKATQDSYWLLIFLEWEAIATSYLTLAEQVLESI